MLTQIAVKLKIHHADILKHEKNSGNIISMSLSWKKFFVIKSSQPNDESKKKIQE